MGGVKSTDDAGGKPNSRKSPKGGSALKAGGFRLGVAFLRSVGLIQPMKRLVLGLAAHIEPPAIHKARNKKSNVEILKENDKALRRIKSSKDRPVLVGPWLSELGFEVLYWIPFLNWVVERYKIPRERLVIVSRGGCASWYQSVADRYIDVFDFLTVDEFAELTERRWSEAGGQKQTSLTEADRLILGKAKEVLGKAEVDILHPSLMYNAFKHFWRGHVGFKGLTEHAVYRNFVPPPRGKINEWLPDDYVAVRFYFRPSFPDTLPNRQFIRSTLESLAQNTNVVMLNPGFSVDDHVDFEPGARDRIFIADDFMSPRNNLEAQSAIIANARAFVGTYGGLAYLPPFYGVPSYAFYSDPQHFLPVHLEAAYRALHGRPAKLFVFNPEEVNHLQRVFGGPTGAQGSSLAGAAE